MALCYRFKHILYHFLLIFSISFILFNLAGCDRLILKRPVPKDLNLIKIPSSQYPDFSDDMAYNGLKESILQSISYLNKIPSDRKFTFGEDVFDTGSMLKSMKHFMAFIETNPSQQDLNRFIAQHYQVYQSKGYDSQKQVLFTGYYEPVLKGNPTQSDEYRFPVYKRPDDLITIDLSLFSSRYTGRKIIGRFFEETIIPYYERKEIENDPFFEKKARPIAWAKDPVDLFFLHIQGSGKMLFPNGDLIRVHYHTSNGRPYRSIGKYLIDEGKIPLSEMSMQAIRSYLKDHPEEVQTVLYFNPSYVFFEIIEDGPIGCIQTKLIPGRSIALDKQVFPLSALAFIETKKPVIDGKGEIQNWSNLSRFVMNHDTGGAIKGPGRVDLFWGDGAYAEIAAGHLKHPGKLYFIMLKPDITSSKLPPA
ncbi:MAG: murein transglycosylase A [Deltaproteobacteria bacterium]|nr:murein transglycosylase A [Deltaproteobacteria bacterium]